MQKVISQLVSHLRLRWCLVVALALYANNYSPAWGGDYTPPELVKVSTPVYHPRISEFNPPLGTYAYTVSWQGIPAADVEVSLEQEGLNYRMQARAKTYSGIDIFYKLRYQAESWISAVDMSPIRAVFENRENSKRKYTEIRYLQDGRVYSFRRTNDQAPTELEFTPDNAMLEPFAAAMLARSLHWELGDSRQFDTFNGKTRYLITLKATDLVKMQVNDQVRDVWVVSPTVLNLTEPSKNNKLRDARIYVTADEKRELLQIVSEVFIGSVTTRLNSFTPSGRSATGIRIARAEVEPRYLD